MTELIDSHLHLWDRDRFTYPWMAGLPDLPRTSRPGELETAATGAIVIEAGAARDEAFAEVEWLTRIAAGPRSSAASSPPSTALIRASPRRSTGSAPTPSSSG